MGTAPGKAVPFYGSATSSSGYYLTHGVAGPVAHPIFYAIRNDTLPLLLYKGFGSDKKWLTVSNGIGSRSAGPTEARVWTQRLLRYRDPSLWRSIVEIGITFGPLAILWVLMWLSYRYGFWWLTLLLAVPAAVADKLIERAS